MPGPIALVGSGEFLPAMEAVDRELLAGRPQRAVFMPTAAALEDDGRIDYWLNLGASHYERLGVEPVPLRLLTRDDAEDESFAAALAGAGLIYLSGGNPGYLAETLRGSRVAQAIRSAWEGGAALAGCSAGAMALTAIAHDTAAEGFASREGIGIAPHLFVLPHFDQLEGWSPGIVERALREAPAGVTIVGVDEDTAILGGPERWVVRGRQRAWIIGPDGGRTPYEPGETIEVPQPAAV